MMAEHPLLFNLLMILSINVSKSFKRMESALGPFDKLRVLAVRLRSLCVRVRLCLPSLSEVEGSKVEAEVSG
jgi:hypothetical protein